MSTNLETLESVWTSNPGGLLFAQYADALQREGRGREAQTVLTEGLQKWPRHFAGKLLLGRLLEEVGNLDAARAAYQEAVAIDNNSPAALRSLAVLLGKQQYQRQAIDLWVRLSLLDPNNPESAATARKMIADLETTSSLADLGLGVRDVEDAASREALSEGTSSGFATRGMSGLESNSPLAGWNSEGALASPDPVFDLGDLAFPTPPSMVSPTPAAASTANWNPNTEIESGTHPMVDPVSVPEAAKPLLGPTEDSGFATLEMASFPARSIPPPPLELPKPLTASGNESDTRIISPVPPLVPPAPVVVGMEDEPAATQAMPRPQASAPVTGDDIGARLDALFADSDAEPGSVVETVADIPAAPSPSAILEMPKAPATIELPADLATAPTSAMEMPTRVSGEDVADRLSELFGSPSETAELLAPPAPEPPPAARQSTAAPRAAVTGNDIEARLDDLFGASEVDLPVVAPLEEPKAPTAAIQTSAAVSGRDIEDRLDSLFGSETDVRKDTLKASETSALDRDSLFADVPSETAEATLENMRAFETAASPLVHGLSQRPEDTKAFEPIQDPSSADSQALLAAATDPSDVDSGGSTLDLPTVGDMPSNPPPAGATGRLTGQDLDSQLDELFASSEFLLDDAPPPSPRKAAPAAATGPVTGDDIGDRLDDLFGSDSDIPAGVPTVTLAEEYLRQGYKDQALAVYRQLAAKDPSNSEISRRIADIEAAGN